VQDPVLRPGAAVLGIAVRPLFRDRNPARLDVVIHHPSGLH
jgi:hypothetical protein